LSRRRRGDEQHETKRPHSHDGFFTSSASTVLSKFGWPCTLTSIPFLSSLQLTFVNFVDAFVWTVWPISGNWRDGHVPETSPILPCRSIVVGVGDGAGGGGAGPGVGPGSGSGGLGAGVGVGVGAGDGAGAGP